MKKLSYLFILLFAFTACTQDKKETTQNVEKLVIEPVITTKPSEIADVPWMAVIDSTSQKISMQQSDLVKTEDLSPNNIVRALASKYPELKIVWKKQINDTAFVNIPNATYLTQGIGSMGAQIFMAEAVYSFTQIPEIKFVNFDFKQGDHASPGTFSRADFTFSK